MGVLWGMNDEVTASSRSFDRLSMDKREQSIRNGSTIVAYQGTPGYIERGGGETQGQRLAPEKKSPSKSLHQDSETRQYSFRTPAQDLYPRQTI